MKIRTKLDFVSTYKGTTNAYNNGGDVITPQTLILPDARSKEFGM